MRYTIFAAPAALAAARASGRVLLAVLLAGSALAQELPPLPAEGAAAFGSEPAVGSAAASPAASKSHGATHLARQFAPPADTAQPSRIANQALETPDSDPDFAAQGEYSGRVTGGFRLQRLGWQVVALGQGRFRGVEFTGGLPGSGFDGRSRSEFEGRREGAFVVFQCGPRTATIAGPRIWIRRADDGLLLGILEKVQRRSPTLGAPPPRGAVVLFDGRPSAALRGAKVTPQGWLEVGAVTAMPVRDFSLHVEFRTPFMPDARGQARGNSGVYIQQRYEVQILDSFGLQGLDNECGGLYRQRRPDLNMCLPPLAWQTFDIEFRAARYDEAGQKLAAARITVWHNGIQIHDDYELKAKTGGGQQEGPEALPILFQNHGNAVHYRNLWLMPR